MSIKFINFNPINFSPLAKKKLKKYFDYFEVFTLKKLQKEICDANIIFFKIEKFKLTRKTLNKALKLKYIVTNTTGIDHIDTKFCEKQKITIISLNDDRKRLNLIKSSSEYSWAMILALIRKIPQSYYDFIQGKIKNRYDYRGNELFKKKIGIIGLGRNGKNILRYAKAFGMIPYTWDINSKKYNNSQSQLLHLLKNSDIISIHIPLNSLNYNFFDKRKIDLMKKNAILINSSRGDVVDEQYLFQALKNKKIGGIAIDVLGTFFSNKINFKKLISYSKKNDNILISPHVAGVTTESLKLSEEIVSDLIVKKCF